MCVRVSAIFFLTVLKCPLPVVRCCLNISSAVVVTIEISEHYISYDVVVRMGIFISRGCFFLLLLLFGCCCKKNGRISSLDRSIGCSARRRKKGYSNISFIPCIAIDDDALFGLFFALTVGVSETSQYLQHASRSRGGRCYPPWSVASILGRCRSTLNLLRSIYLDLHSQSYAMDTNLTSTLFFQRTNRSYKYPDKTRVGPPLSRASCICRSLLTAELAARRLRCPRSWRSWMLIVTFFIVMV